MCAEKNTDLEFSELEEGVEIPNTIEKLLDYAIDEARTKLVETGEFVPFTVLLQGEDLYFETHPGDDPDECRDSALRTVRTAGEAIESSVFCYDGFIDLDDGEHDAIIVEANDCEAAGTLVFCDEYTIDEQGNFDFSEEVALLEIDEQ